MGLAVILPTRYGVFCMAGSQLNLFLVFCLSLIFVSSARAEDEIPYSTDPRLKIELFAESPQIVTPTGVDVDHLGRVWAIESNTHFPPEGYAGHPTDRILVMQGADKDGKAAQISVFKDGLIHSMSIAVKPVWLDVGRSFGRENQNAGHAANAFSGHQRPFEVYVATRREILLCTDSDGDLKCDDVKPVVRLETLENYPHNGLAGFAFDAIGYVYFGFGENKGADYKVIGSDGITLTGGGEGGNIYRCRPDGSKLEHWATGFWNPHASCFDAFGRLFTLDNDPDSRPPCRLLHIIQGGDYGYRFRNGRKGTHPFTSWNGEIPGTLPMVSGTGEAPSGMVCYESDGFPQDYIGTLLVGSWGDHRIDQFVLKPRGASFEAIPHPIIKGGQNFRPVGLAIAPDGSMYVTDWVLKEYKLHGKGRVWRISAKEIPHFVANASTDPGTERRIPELEKSLDSPVLNQRRLAANLLAVTDDGRKVLERIRNEKTPAIRRQLEARWAGPNYVEPQSQLDLATADLTDPFQLMCVINQTASLFVKLVDQVVTTSTEDGSSKKLFTELKFLDPVTVEKKPRENEFRQIAKLLALRLKFPKEQSLVHIGLDSKDPSVLRLAVQWIGEENFKQLRPEVERVLASEPITNELFMACLASLSLLDGVSPKEFEKTPPAQYILAIITNVERPSSLRATALRMLPSSQKELDAKLLGEMLATNDPDLRRETVRTLQHSPIVERDQLLRGIAVDEAIDPNLRADAVAGLAQTIPHAELDVTTRDLLIKLALADKNLAIRLEAIRSLRSSSNQAKDQTPHDKNVVDFLKRLSSNILNEPEAVRIPLIEALKFNSGQRTARSVKESLAEFAGADSKNTSPETGIGSKGSAESGRRAFYHVNGAGCYKCHMVGGRGGQVGPDLTVIARTMDRKKLAESILEPSKEISPQFTTWAIETKNGKVLNGMLLGEEVNGDLRLGNNQGEIFFVPFNEIETRAPMPVSIMPEKLHETMTATELRDLIAFLETLK